MAQYPTRARLIGDILASAQDYSSIEDIRQRYNVSHRRMSNMVQTLVEQGLIERAYNETNHKYRISSRGQDFLREYNEFRSFVEKYGLSM